MEEEKYILEAQQVAIVHKGFSLTDIKFEIFQGDIFGLVGRSGSGKSTILKTLIGEYNQSSGHFVLKKGLQEHPLDEHLGYSPQDNALFENLTLEENILLFGRLRGMRKVDILDRSEALLRRLRLSKAKKKRITELSGGMRKRADLTVALLHDPKVLVLDEPFTGLDVALNDFIWELLHELSKKGKIIILSSHDLVEVEEHCSQYGLVRRGSFYNTQDLLQAVKGDKSEISEYLKEVFLQDSKEEMK